jgi:KDO2-lipid IV(A) lauroyltransferase
VGPEVSDVQLEALVRQACVHITKGHYDLFRVARLSKEQIKSIVHLEGWENLERALARGRWVIVVSAHFGNVELVMQIPAIHGMPAMSPVLRTRPERLFRYARALRESHGLRLIPTDEPMVPLFRALKRGEMIGLATDRDLADSARVVEFFGTPTRLPDGPVRVGLRTGAVLLPAFGLRLPDDSVVVQVEPPLELPRTGDEEADIEAGMRLVVVVMERHIRPHPEQWLVAKRVWPPEAPEAPPEGSERS